VFERGRQRAAATAERHAVPRQEMIFFDVDGTLVDHTALLLTVQAPTNQALVRELAASGLSLAVPV
jgi:hypothetical protein